MDQPPPAKRKYTYSIKHNYFHTQIWYIVSACVLVVATYLFVLYNVVYDSYSRSHGDIHWDRNSRTSRELLWTILGAALSVVVLGVTVGTRPGADESKKHEDQDTGSVWMDAANVPLSTRRKGPSGTPPRLTKKEMERNRLIGVSTAIHESRQRFVAWTLALQLVSLVGDLCMVIVPFHAYHIASYGVVTFLRVCAIYWCWQSWGVLSSWFRTTSDTVQTGRAISGRYDVRDVEAHLCSLCGVLTAVFVLFVAWVALVGTAWTWGTWPVTESSRLHGLTDDASLDLPQTAPPFRSVWGFVFPTLSCHRGYAPPPMAQVGCLTTGCLTTECATLEELETGIEAESLGLGIGVPCARDNAHDALVRPWKERPGTVRRDTTFEKAWSVVSSLIGVYNARVLDNDPSLSGNSSLLFLIVVHDDPREDRTGWLDDELPLIVADIREATHDNTWIWSTFRHGHLSKSPHLFGGCWGESGLTSVPVWSWSGSVLEETTDTLGRQRDWMPTVQWVANQPGSFQVLGQPLTGVLDRVSNVSASFQNATSRRLLLEDAQRQHAIDVWAQSLGWPADTIQGMREDEGDSANTTFQSSVRGSTQKWVLARNVAVAIGWTTVCVVSVVWAIQIHTVLPWSFLLVSFCDLLTCMCTCFCLRKSLTCCCKEKGCCFEGEAEGDDGGESDGDAARPTFEWGCCWQQHVRVHQRLGNEDAAIRQPGPALHLVIRSMVNDLYCRALCFGVLSVLGPYGIHSAVVYGVWNQSVLDAFVVADLERGRHMAHAIALFAACPVAIQLLLVCVLFCCRVSNAEYYVLMVWSALWSVLVSSSLVVLLVGLSNVSLFPHTLETWFATDMQYRLFWPLLYATALSLFAMATVLVLLAIGVRDSDPSADQRLREAEAQHEGLVLDGALRTDVLTMKQRRSTVTIADLFALKSSIFMDVE